jgi:S-adenosylmethionine:tRNA ribosyltransferase-isomerase
VVDRHEGLFELQFEDSVNVYQILERIGQTPLPFYIKRQAEAHDAERYQTVYARYPGAVAAPTAGMHFDAPLLDTLRRRRVQLAFVTLHVAAGTFQPVRAERIEEHRMHSEYAAVSAQVCEQIIETKKRGGRVIAVGTTTVRALESAALAGKPRAFHADTGVFIYPGHTFRCVDAIITNFHLPESSLLMLVSAFAGLAPLLRAYRHAVAQGYRFFSYGDAMLVARNNLTRRGF